MTLREVLRAALRRWYVVSAVLLIGAFGAFLLQRDGGTFATRTSVVFTLPGEAPLLPENGATDERVIAFAAGVAQELNGGRPVETYAAADAPSYGAGVREGVWVGLPNYGGQWVQSYGLAQIEVQIVGRTEEGVRSIQTEMLDRVSEIAVARQVESGVSEAERIQTSIIPLTSQIDHISASRSATLLAFAAMGAASLLVGLWLAVRLENGSLPHHRRRTTSVAWGQTDERMRAHTR